MTIKEIIKNRKTIRKYSDKKVADETITELLEACRLAPSGNNAQPWRFRIIRDEKTKKLLKDNKIFVQDFVYEAPVIIICCADPTKYPQPKEEDDADEIRAVRDLSIGTAS